MFIFLCIRFEHLFTVLCYFQFASLGPLQLSVPLCSQHLHQSRDLAIPTEIATLRMDVISTPAINHLPWDKTLISV